MNNASAIAVLNRLLAIHYRSLPMYLTGADPWTQRGDDRATAAVRDIVESHKAMTNRLADEIMRRGGAVDAGDFPEDYTELNFLSLDYLLREIIEGLDRDIDDIESCAAQVASDAPAKALADEALGMARGHRQTIQEISSSVSSGA